MPNKTLDLLFEGNNVVELTSSDPETVAARKVMEGDATWRGWDAGGCVYWSPNKARCVVIWD